MWQVIAVVSVWFKEAVKAVWALIYRTMFESFKLFV
jgi:hypothetical protein